MIAYLPCFGNSITKMSPESYGFLELRDLSEGVIFFSDLPINGSVYLTMT